MSDFASTPSQYTYDRPLDYPELDNIPFDSNFKFLKNKEALTVQHTGRGYSVEGVVV